MSRSVTKSSFLKDVKTHEMEVLLNQDVYRHMRFKRPNTITLSFTLTTTPGRLIYGGDMGCYVFQRLPDMFQFFRAKGGDLNPNFGYWHEKLQAVDRVSGSEERSVHKFRENLEGYIDHRHLSGAQVGEVREFIDDVCSRFEDAPEFAYQEVAEFELDGDEFFTDFWELNDKDFTLRYQWACYAIQWGIGVYDQYMEAAHVST